MGPLNKLNVNKVLLKNKHFKENGIRMWQCVSWCVQCAVQTHVRTTERVDWSYPPERKCVTAGMATVDLTVVSVSHTLSATFPFSSFKWKCKICSEQKAQLTWNDVCTGLKIAEGRISSHCSLHRARVFVICESRCMESSLCHVCTDACSCMCGWQ